VNGDRRGIARGPAIDGGLKSSVIAGKAFVV
jgi:hypothetical protein